MAHLQKELTLFLFCMFAIGYHCNALAASIPGYKPYLCPPAVQMYGGAHYKTKAKYPMLRPRDREDDSEDLGPKTILPTIYEKMQLNGDKEALVGALHYLEQKFSKGCWPSFGMKEIKEILNSPLTNYLYRIKTDDLAVVKTKIESLGLAISQGTYKNPLEYIKAYNAAVNIYAKRHDHTPIQEDDGKEEEAAAIVHEKKIALDAVAQQTLAAQRGIELAKQQLLVQAEKITDPLECADVYKQIDALEKRYRDLSMSDFLYDLAHLEQEKQALLKQAKRSIYTLEREKLYCQADVIEAAIQALALRVE